MPILALAESPWANSAQRLALVLDQHENLRQQIEDLVVPVLVDPGLRPDLAARWRTAAATMSGTIGPPLLLLLSDEGLPFMTYCTMSPEGDAEHPSLSSLLTASSDAYRRDAEAIRSDARRLRSASRKSGSGKSLPSPKQLWEALQADVDKSDGGLDEQPKHPHPQLLWLLLDLAQSENVDSAAEFVGLTLRRLLRGGIKDQLDSGFHRCSRDSRWVIPHFEKPLPLNAQLAAVLVRASRVFGLDEFVQAANDTAVFCLRGLADEIDVVASDSYFYTWTSREVLDVVEPELAQAAGFYFHITPDKSRHVLYRAIEPEEMHRFSHEAPKVLRARVDEAVMQLCHARSARSKPAIVRVPGLAWQATTLLWLFEAADQGASLPVPRLVQLLENLTAKPFDRRVGYRRDKQEGPAWLEDQVSMAAVLLVGYRATSNQKWLRRAQELAEIVLSEYSNQGGWRDRSDSHEDEEPSLALTDHLIPATVATLIGCLTQLAVLSDDERFAETVNTWLATNPSADLPPSPWLAALYGSAYSARILGRQPLP